MMKRLVLKLIHTIATASFTFLEVAGLPRVREEKGAGREGRDGP